MTYHVGIERIITDERADEMLRAHHHAFDALDTLAAEPQSIDDDHFLELLAHPDVLEFVARTDNGFPAALIMSTTALDLIPWIRPAFFAARYPEHTSRRAVFYVPCLQIDPEHRQGPLLHALIETYALYIGARQGLIAFDTCRWDIENVAVPAFIERIGLMTIDGTCDEIDAQHYFGFDVRNIKSIDLRERVHPEVTIDHHVPQIDETERRVSS